MSAVRQLYNVRHEAPAAAPLFLPVATRSLATVRYKLASSHAVCALSIDFACSGPPRAAFELYVDAH